MIRRIWGTDIIRFRIQGDHPQQYLNQAAAQSVRLAGVHREKSGFMARAFGRDRDRLRQMAVQGGWEYTDIQRRGPGHWLEVCGGRPGLVVGCGVFLLLLHYLSLFVWTIDFGSLEGATAERMRYLLAECGICEGTLLREEVLYTAQTAALEQSDLFGWVSLNFAGGCLFVENTAAQNQTIREEAPLRPLYAKADGVVTAVEAESGFVCVAPGETVTAGQMLVNTVRLDHDGREILQGAQGSIVARCEQTYTASCLLEEAVTILQSESHTQDRLFFMGYSKPLQHSAAEADGYTITDWIPLRLGRLSLPGCIQRTTTWTQKSQNMVRSAEQAKALASRTCRQQLLAEFPDAEILSERREVQTDSEGVTVKVTYQFSANIAYTPEG